MSISAANPTNPDPEMTLIRLLRWLIWGDGHLHKWVPYGDLTRCYWEDGDKLPFRRQQSFQCEACGKIRIFNV